jgi:hypothetical protein
MRHATLLFWRSSAAAAFLLASGGAALAQGKPAEPSVYLRCDGNPPHRSTGEMLGRALLLTATLGVAGQGEVQDVSKRAMGNDGIDACTQALQSETDPVRKVQLMLARSIHRIEAGDYAGAADDARDAPSQAGAAADEVGFRHTMLVSALGLQATAQLRGGQAAEAEATAFKMAAAAPYEVLTQIQATPFAQLTPNLTPEKQAFLDRLVKVFPEALGLRAAVYQWAGKYAEAAQDYAAVIDLRAGFSPGNDPPPMPDVLALRSVMLAMAGQMDKSAAVAKDAAAMIQFLSASGKAGTMQASVDAAEQALDFQAIVADLNAGRASVARTKFSARSRWSVPGAPTVADLAARLRQGAPAAELTGSLAADPATLRTNALIANAGAITEANNANANLYGRIRQPLSALFPYDSWRDDIWNTKESYFLHQRAANETYIGDLLVVPNTPRLFKAMHPITIAAGEALLLHTALLAQARGDKGFALAMGRQQLGIMLVHIGNPGEPGLPMAASFDAAAVIADLSAEFPDPAAKAAPGSP